MTSDLPATWEKALFGELAVEIRDRVQPDAIDPDIPYVGLEHAAPGALHLNGVGQGSDVTSAKSRFEAGDILFGKLRPYFRKVIRPGFDGVCSTDMWVVRPQQGVHAGYLFYLMAHPDFIAFASAGSEGTRMPRAKWEHVSRYEVALPPIAEQQAIAEMLGAIDDKIEHNRTMADTLDALMDAQFSDLQSIGSDQADIAVPLSEIAEYINGRAFTKHANGKGRMVIRIAELNSGPSNSTKYAEIEADPGYVANFGDILFAWSGSLGVYRWYRAPALINQHIFKVLPARGLPEWFVFYQLRRAMPYFKSIAADKATTMGHIRRSHLSDVKAIMPPDETMSEHDDLMRPLWRMWLNLHKESLVLGEIRDALLPRLLSGELRLVDAEKLVGEAL